MNGRINGFRVIPFRLANALSMKVPPAPVSMRAQVAMFRCPAIDISQWIVCREQSVDTVTLDNVIGGANIALVRLIKNPPRPVSLLTSSSLPPVVWPSLQRLLQRLFPEAR